MTGSSWQDDVLLPGSCPTLEEGVWRLHPQDSSQFFAEYLPRDFLDELEAAESIGWDRAVARGLAQLSGHMLEYTRDYFLSAYRWDFVDWLGVRPGDAVLDSGCGWGGGSERLLKSGCNVVATDAAQGRLRFCVARMSQQGFGDRFLPIEADVNDLLPIRPGSLAAIVLSGLLEWAPYGRAGDPQEAQRALLRYYRGLLREGGRLYLAIENRFWAPYFAGALDLHTRQPLVSILPRRLARAFSLILSGKDYRAYTYSLAGYLVMLREAGFRELGVRVPEPDYVQPRKVRTVLERLDLEGSSGDLLARLAAAGPSVARALLARSYMFVATK